MFVKGLCYKLVYCRINDTMCGMIVRFRETKAGMQLGTVVFVPAGTRSGWRVGDEYLVMCAMDFEWVEISEEESLLYTLAM